MCSGKMQSENDLPQCRELLLDCENGVLAITLNRPHKRNAMNISMVQELMAVFEQIASDRTVRAVVIEGGGGHFCAGGDISTMNDGDTGSDHGVDAASGAPTAAQREQAAWRFNRLYGEMIARVNHAPQVVITLLRGAVMGGGLGLACVSDVAIADSDARFAMPETSLGLIPAQIAPFVVSRIGLTQARRLALLAEPFDGVQALKLGLVHHEVSGEEAMSKRLDEVLARLRRCAPQATATTKALLHQVGCVDLETLLDGAADSFFSSLNGSEGKEGTRAFAEKRKPAWAS
ncbi:MAG: enoyl-CoA hydratase-related protein [Haliea sp.]